MLASRDKEATRSGEVISFGVDRPKGHVLDSLPELPHDSASSEEDLVSSDEDDLASVGDESLVGVSISREQSRLVSASTPAAEKSAAFDWSNQWGFFDGAEEEIQQELLLNTLKNSSKPEDPQTNQFADPERGHASVKEGKRASYSAESSHDGNIPRARSSVINFWADTGIKRFISGLNFNPLAEPSKSSNRGSDLRPEDTSISSAQGTRHGRSNSLFLNKISWGTVSPRSYLSSGSSETEPIPSHQAEALSRKLRTTPRQLRRTASDDSLVRPPISRHSTLSGSSILGEEPNLNHVKQQVNSRGKAIRDSLQTSLPQLPNIDLSAIRPSIVSMMLRDSERIESRQTSIASGSETLDSRASHLDSQQRSESPPKVLKSRSPILDSALEKLTGDVVVMGGYRGSILREASFPHRQLWVPLKVGLGVRKVNLEVGLSPEEEENMTDRIVPSGMLTHIGPVDMSRRLIKRLRHCANSKNGSLRVWEYGYDWRLSPALLSRKLIQFLCELPCNGNDSQGATVIAHSLGGLITRHAVNQRPDLFAGVLYAGTPQHCVNILGPLRNGDDVLLSSKVLTAQVNFTFRTSFLLLPENGHCFINKETREQYPVDFFKAETWQQYALSPCVASVQPPFAPSERKTILGTLSNSLPSFNPFTNATSGSSSPPPPPVVEETAQKAENMIHPSEGTIGMHMSSITQSGMASTIPRPMAMAYLRRVLDEIRQFKKALHHDSTIEAQNRYPPHALIYGTSVPTVYGARVASRDAIKHSDAYDDLAFASGDGVVLARAAVLPRGYRTVRGGRVKTERGHVSMLGDLEAVGHCLLGLMQDRDRGVGRGVLP